MFTSPDKARPKCDFITGASSKNRLMSGKGGDALFINKNMDLFPKKQEDLMSCIKTGLKGGALISDVILTKGIAQFLLNKFYDVRLSKTLKELRNISEELKEDIHKKVSMDYIKSDDFVIFLSNAIEEAISLKNLEKLKYFRSAIINGMVRRDIKKDKKLLFIDCLANLPLDSLLLLKTIDEGVAKDRAADFPFSWIRDRAKYNDSDYLMANLKRLERYYLIEIKVGDIWSESDRYGNYSINYDKFGKAFLSFITQYQ